jgi:hypothetical protein
MVSNRKQQLSRARCLLDSVYSCPEGSPEGRSSRFWQIAIGCAKRKFNESRAAEQSAALFVLVCRSTIRCREGFGGAFPFPEQHVSYEFDFEFVYAFVSSFVIFS